mgnify:CR=1 FL=1
MHWILRSIQDANSWSDETFLFSVMTLTYIHSHANMVHMPNSWPFIHMYTSIWMQCIRRSSLLGRRKTSDKDNEILWHINGRLMVDNSRSWFGDTDNTTLGPSVSVLYSQRLFIRRFCDLATSLCQILSRGESNPCPYCP